MFLGAFLLFVVQPLLGRFLLPWFGGSATVWSAVMLFFQTALLAGYAYAHLLSTRLSPRAQVLTHLTLMGVTLVSMTVLAFLWGTPLTPGLEWKPSPGTSLVAHALLLLTLVTGLPAFLLASTSSTLQAWYNRIRPGDSAYRFYAISNGGSLLGLAAYPLLFEPFLGVPSQSLAWSAGFLVFAALMAACALVFRAEAGPRAPELTAPDEYGRVPSLPMFSLWLVSAACGVVLMLGTINLLSREVAVVPMVWTLPFAVYLLTFIVTFSGRGPHRRRFWTIALGLCTVATVVSLSDQWALGIGTMLTIYLCALASACMVCHGELHRLRPAPGFLTMFYLAVALGGALGGVFATLVAPLLFGGFFEYHLALVLVWFLAAAAAGATDEWEAVPRRRAFRLYAVTAGFFASLLLGTVAYIEVEETVYCARNFHGVTCVHEMGADNPKVHLHALRSGGTTHGLQYVHEPMRSVPTSYYAEDSGIGLAILEHPKQFGEAQPLRIGCLGLGTGSIAVYCMPGYYFRFYEIDQAVIALAGLGGHYFTYLDDCPGTVDVIPGDARISMEGELARGEGQQFDVLAIDAFAGDSIPVHLITKEAVEVYLEHLAQGGILAFNLSNRYVDMEPVVEAIAKSLGLHTAIRYGTSNEDWGTFATDWLLATRDGSFFARPETSESLESVQASPTPAHLWTDARSNLLSVIRTDVLWMGEE